MFDLPYAHNAAKELCQSHSDEDLDALILAWLEIDPNREMRSEVRLQKYYIHVWAIVGAIEAYRGDLADAAAAYDVPVEAVRAALAFYSRNRAVIDARIEANEGEFTSLLAPLGQ